MICLVVSHEELHCLENQVNNQNRAGRETIKRASVQETFLPRPPGRPGSGGRGLGPGRGLGRGLTTEKDKS